MIAKPTTTSAAATTIEKNASTWPSSARCIRENATSARFTAFSCSSTDMKISSAFFRNSTPSVPSVNNTPDSTMKYAIGVLTVGSSRSDSSAHRLELRLGHRAGLPLSQHHGRDRGDDQQDRRGLEREEVVAEQHLRDRLRVARVVHSVEPRRRLRREADPCANRQHDLDHEPHP